MCSKPRKFKRLQAGIRKFLRHDTPQTPSSQPLNPQVASVSPASASSSAPPPLVLDPADIPLFTPTSNPDQIQPSSGLPVASTITEDENSAWAGLRKVLQGLENHSDLLPPLKPIFSTLINCVNSLSEVDKRRREFRQLALNLTATLNSLSQYLFKTSSNEMSRSVQSIINGIQQQIEYVATKQQRNKLSRYAQAVEDGDSLVECYRQLNIYFQQLQVDAMMGIWSNTDKQLIDACLDLLAPAMQAQYNSAQAAVVRRHKPNTPKIYWLNGMAGTGKTTIANTLSDELKKTCQLGASFFCSGLLPECCDVTRLIPTISYQLAGFSSAFRSALCKALGDDRDLSSYDIDTQFNKLIRDPLLAVKENLSKNIVVIIDALDELSNSSDAPMVLDLLFRYAMDLPIKFFLTSRPEPGIRERILSRDSYSRTILYLHDIDQSFVEADIETYLKDELKSISPSETQIQQLTAQAGSLFIYAATAVRYILPDSMSGDPHRRLETMLEMSSSPSSKKHVAIDALYTAILTRALENIDLEPEEADDIRLVLHAAICVKEPLSTGALASLLGLEYERRVVSALQPLRSVLNVHESTGLISALHASFPDYMLSQARSRAFYCNKAQLDGMLAERCFHVMHRRLDFNFCRLETSYLLDRNVPNLQIQAIPQALLYSCRQWGSHLLGTDASETLSRLLEQFLSSYLLFWMEVLSLKKCIGIGEVILCNSQKWMEKHGTEYDTREMIKDARKFVAHFAANPVSESTPHIYISALPFWPKTSPVSRKYWKNTQGLVYADEKVVERNGSALMATWLNNTRVLSVAFSPSGAHVVSGCYDSTIRVWDAQTGALVPGLFRGHTYGVTSVAFSSDSAFIVSGSYDRCIYVWDAKTGTAISGPFKGHTNAISSVIFSPDDARIVSGSWDFTVRVWDAHTGTQAISPFRGHTSGVTSVAFLPDGTHIASGSWDNTIRIWNIHTGTVVSGPFNGNPEVTTVALTLPTATTVALPFEITTVASSPDGTRIACGSDDRTIRVLDVRTGAVVSGPFRGHTESVLSVAFSPDGTRIASASSDKSIRVWDALTGAIVSGPFEGHRAPVASVAFSPDGARIVSGSDDKTVRIWDAHSGALMSHSFPGHTNVVRSVAFSPDGTRIASGSDDRNIYVWDAETGVVVSALHGHRRGVSSVAFSSDGTRVVSGCYDRTIRLWDVQTGTMVFGSSTEYKGTVTSVAFSPDGTRIASGSDDKTILVWDARAGTVLSGPFQGHTYVVRSVAFSPDGAHIVSGSDDHTVRIWDAQTGTMVSGPFVGHTEAVISTAFSPYGTCVVSGSSDCTIRVWDAQTGITISGPFRGHTHRVTSVAFSPDGTRILSGSWDNTIRVWDAQTGAVVCEPFRGHIDSVWSAFYSPDGARIVSCSTDHTIRVWDAQYADVTNINNWRMNDSGWITTGPDEKLMVWVPPELRSGLYWPRNTLVICVRGSFRLDFNNTLHGKNWDKCYVGQ